MKAKQEKPGFYSLAWGVFSLSGLVFMLLHLSGQNPLDILAGIALVLLQVSVAIFADLYVPRGERFVWNVALSTFAVMVLLFLFQFVPDP